MSIRPTIQPKKVTHVNFIDKDEMMARNTLLRFNGTPRASFYQKNADLKKQLDPFLYRQNPYFQKLKSNKTVIYEKDQQFRKTLNRISSLKESIPDLTISQSNFKHSKISLEKSLSHPTLEQLQSKLKEFKFKSTFSKSEAHYIRKQKEFDEKLFESQFSPNPDAIQEEKQEENDFTEIDLEQQNQQNFEKTMTNLQETNTNMDINKIMQNNPAYFAHLSQTCICYQCTCGTDVCEYVMNQLSNKVKYDLPLQTETRSNFNIKEKEDQLKAWKYTDLAHKQRSQFIDTCTSNFDLFEKQKLLNNKRESFKPKYIPNLVPFDGRTTTKQFFYDRKNDKVREPFTHIDNLNIQNELSSSLGKSLYQDSFNNEKKSAKGEIVKFSSKNMKSPFTDIMPFPKDSTLTFSNSIVEKAGPQEMVIDYAPIMDVVNNQSYSGSFQTNSRANYLGKPKHVCQAKINKYRSVITKKI